MKELRESENNTFKFETQRHAELCPVCKGEGEVKCNRLTTSGPYTKVCYGCNGIGWVIV